MGAAAFVMADVIGVSYLTIVTAALVPALLYHANLVFGVCFEARKQNLQPMTKAELPKLERKDYLSALRGCGLSDGFWTRWSDWANSTKQ